MTDMNYDAESLKDLKYVKITYVDTEDKVCEVVTETRRIDNDLVSLYIKSKKNINVTCPQTITIKFVAQIVCMSQ